MKPADYPAWPRVIVVATLALFTVNLFFFIGPLSALVTAAASLIDKRDIVTAVGTISASFFGAWLAFRFAKVQRQKERTDDDVAAGNRALFTLSEMWNSVKQHQMETVDPMRGRHGAWLNLSVGRPLGPLGLTIDSKDLSFVLQSRGSAFQEVMLEQVRFKYAAYLVEEHRRLVLGQVFPRLAGAGMGVGEARDEREIKEMLGVDVVHQLAITTSAIIECIDEDEKSLRRAFATLRSALKKIYPNHSFIDFQFNAPVGDKP